MVQRQVEEVRQSESLREAHVLLVDDESDFADMTGSFLKQEHEMLTVTTATSAHDGLDRLREANIDAIVSDFDMPSMNGLEFLRPVREDYPDLPFILFTGKGSEEIAGKAISAGVTDYLQKGTGTEQYTLLANRITNAIEQTQTRRELE